MAPSATHKNNNNGSVRLTAPGAKTATAKNGRSIVRQTPRILAHVVFRTTPANYKPMIQFYCNLLNAHVVHEDPVLAFLAYDDEHHRIAIICSPDAVPKPKDVTHAGLDHIAFTYPTLTALSHQYVYLKNCDTPILPLWCVNHGPTTSMYYRDLDGNKIELQVDNFDDPDEANDFMAGEKYDANPMGTDFDPDRWSEYILGKATADGQEGLSAKEIRDLKMRKEIGERKELPAGF
ncbi:hypothetical protein H2204_002064 [Knufia peltigerae]|uniref:VOC domain-containing protein n=1 Tax=Knufia peltigerae TaxID=1002370 RepID=A0AA38YDB8_9EURO|nr:hypothetical protein H2204_002064 [Knufia peltigerae]